MTTVSATRPSDKQLAFARSLYAEHAELFFSSERFLAAPAELQTELRQIDAECTARLDTMSRREISEKIDSMLGIVRRLRAAARPVAPVDELESGIYGGNGSIVKVYRGQSGRMLAKLLVISDGEASFVYQGMATRFVKGLHKLSLDEAKSFGAIYGVCCNCGATLTDEGSIAAGIGPVCAKRF